MIDPKYIQWIEEVSDAFMIQVDGKVPRCLPL